MRAFLALPLPEHVHNELQRISRILEPLRITQTLAQHHHLTLHFFTDLTREHAAELSKKLATFTFTPFTAHILPPDTFPPDGSARVIYAGTGPAAPFTTLHDALHARLGIPKDARPFTPHITLSRITEGHITAHHLEFITIPPLQWTVDHVILYKSELTPHGPKHTELARSPAP